MKVIYQPELAERKAFAEIAEAATPVLEQAIGAPAARVTATWGLRVDGSRNLIRLTIADWSGQATAEFEPAELKVPDPAWRKFLRLWGDLLQEVSERITRELKTVGTEGQDS